MDRSQTLPHKRRRAFTALTAALRVRYGWRACLLIETLVALASIAVISADLVLGQAVGQATSRTPSALWLWLGGYIALSLLRVIAFGAYSYVFRHYKVWSLTRLREALINALLGRPLAAREMNDSGVFLTTFTTRLDAIEGQHYDAWYGFQQIVFELPFALIAFVVIKPSLALLAVALLLPTIGVPLALKRRTATTVAAELAATDRLVSRHQATCAAAATIRDDGLAPQAEEALRRHIDDTKRAAFASEARQAWIQTLSSVLLHAGHVIMIFVVAIHVQSGTLSIALAVNAVRLMSRLTYDAGLIAQYVRVLLTARTSFHDVATLIDDDKPWTKRWPHPQVPSQTMPSSIAIVLDAVAYSYGETPLIAPFSWTLTGPGLHLVVGESGRGKSTLMRLLMGHLSPTSGTIAIRPPCDAYETTIAMERQDVCLFDATLRDNLRLFDASLSDNALIDAMMTLGLRALTTRLDDRLDDAHTLSGGEAKRVALVRASLRHVPIVIVDEPLANLDPQSVDDVVAALIALSTTRLVVVVTHDRPPALTLAARSILSLDTSPPRLITGPSSTGPKA